MLLMSPKFKKKIAFDSKTVFSYEILLKEKKEDKSVAFILRKTKQPKKCVINWL